MEGYVLVYNVSRRVQSYELALKFRTSVVWLINYNKYNVTACGRVPFWRIVSQQVVENFSYLTERHGLLLCSKELNTSLYSEAVESSPLPPSLFF